MILANIWGLYAAIAQVQVWVIEPWVWVALGIGSLIFICLTVSARVTAMEPASKPARVQACIDALREARITLFGKEYTGLEMTLLLAPSLYSGIRWLAMPQDLAAAVGHKVQLQNRDELRRVADEIVTLWRREEMLEEWLSKDKKSFQVYDRRFTPGERLGFAVLKRASRDSDRTATQGKG